MNNSLVDSALLLANAVRKSIGLEEVMELLPGIPSDPHSCPIASTIGYGGGYEVEVGALDGVTVRVDCNPIDLDELIDEDEREKARVFINDFDNELIPQYIVEDYITL